MRKIIITVFIFVVLGAIFWVVTKNRTADVSAPEEMSDIMETDEDTKATTPTSAGTSVGSLKNNVSGQGSSVSTTSEAPFGSYAAYSEEKLALAESGDVLLFFHAEWCPICRSIEREITADPSAIPIGVHILKVDYDTAIALRQRYGVTVQHTFVQVDHMGSFVQKFSDAMTLAAVLGRVQ